MIIPHFLFDFHWLEIVSPSDVADMIIIDFTWVNWIMVQLEFESTGGRVFHCKSSSHDDTTCLIWFSSISN